MSASLLSLLLAAERVAGPLARLGGALLLMWVLAAPDASGRSAAFAVSASLPAEELVVGERYEVILEVTAEGSIHKAFPWEMARPPGALRRPIVQLEVPDAVGLVGEPPAQLVTPYDFQESYLAMPFGRRLLDKRTAIPFELLAPPGPDVRLAIHVTTYLVTEVAEEASFVRLRIDLPLQAGAAASGLPSSTSRWSGSETLAIGDEAPDFELPGLDGRRVGFSERRGPKRALVMVYRRST